MENGQLGGGVKKEINTEGAEGESSEIGICSGKNERDKKKKIGDKAKRGTENNVRDQMRQRLKRGGSIK